MLSANLLGTCEEVLVGLSADAPVFPLLITRYIYHETLTFLILTPVTVTPLTLTDLPFTNLALTPLTIPTPPLTPLAREPLYPCNYNPLTLLTKPLTTPPST